MLTTLNFLVKINAPKEKVWDILWNEDTYSQWTAVFCEGSKATSDWIEGSSILFTDGKGNGMYSIIDKKVTNKQMLFKHLGVLKDGVKMPVDDETKIWSGAIEDYQLEELNGVTEVKALMDTTEAFSNYFKDKFPKAFQRVKELTKQS